MINSIHQTMTSTLKSYHTKISDKSVHKIEKNYDIKCFKTYRFWAKFANRKNFEFQVIFFSMYFYISKFQAYLISCKKKFILKQYVINLKDFKTARTATITLYYRPCNNLFVGHIFSLVPPPPPPPTWVKGVWEQYCMRFDWWRSVVIIHPTSL